ncbi:MAG: PilZ domain-containing protein, partial [Candidatus Xenobia bacterium]
GLKLKFTKTLKPTPVYTMRIRGMVVPGVTHGIRELTVQARCVWCRKAGDGYDVGCSFTGFVGANLNQVLDFFREELGIDIGESEQKRTSTRISKRFHVTYTGADGKVASGFIRNLSMTGLQLASKTAVELGSELHVTVDFGAKTEKMHARVEVVRCRKIPREDWFEIGARFTELSEKDSQRLTGLVTAYMKEAWAEG